MSDFYNNIWDHHRKQKQRILDSFFDKSELTNVMDEDEIKKAADKGDTIITEENFEKLRGDIYKSLDDKKNELTEKQWNEELQKAQDYLNTFEKKVVNNEKIIYILKADSNSEE